MFTCIHTFFAAMMMGSMLRALVRASFANLGTNFIQIITKFRTPCFIPQAQRTKIRAISAYGNTFIISLNYRIRYAYFAIYYTSFKSCR